MSLPETRLRSVSIVGSTGTGKTTFGRELAAILDVPFVELDALNWAANWTMTPLEDFQARVADVVAMDGWVIDGNYGGRGARDLVWPRADAIVWLDYSLPVIVLRLWRRTIERVRSGTELWPGTGNRETFRNTFLSRESLLLWAVTRFRPRRRDYPRLLALPVFANAAKYRFRSPRQAERWLATQRSAAAARTA